MYLYHCYFAAAVLFGSLFLFQLISTLDPFHIGEDFLFPIHEPCFCVISQIPVKPCIKRARIGVIGFHHVPLMGKVLQKQAQVCVDFSVFITAVKPK